ncbi:type I-F CRISPR-associated endoribonuclease Cas6/Csy4 [Marinomonas gallaica]|uniref:type I-F CRISPR-associated endoribonuclease Cas6/Csy4 n=1 Tax=Marinomonas gallaica TaxID=1806667 RepID=UPI00083518CD|nr:type I-F CRISPR-associated endoribonuclease Cas6/Csy4 [Marinomonas gallaica]
MKHYIDITLLPSDDIGVHFLWSKLMMQVHLALVEIQDDKQQVPIAVSFPKYQTSGNETLGFVGNKLRLFANDKNDLERLNLGKWLNRLEDYVHMKSIADVPSDVLGYESFNRRRKSGSPDKHIKRRMQRHNETLEQAAEFFKGYNMAKEDKELPFIRMKSLHSDNEFCMSIIRNEAVPSNNSAMFNTYGLSAEGVLPKF